jgi:hypothetical protein
MGGWVGVEEWGVGMRVLKVEFSLSQYFSSGRIYRRTKGYLSAVYR